MSAILQQCMTKIIPTIEDTFKSCIAEYFNETKTKETPQPLPLEAEERLEALLNYFI